MISALTQLLPVVSDVLDRVIPDKDEADKAKMALLRMEREGELRAEAKRLDVLANESNSRDPWTSRARPCFLYVVYIYLLTGLPVGIVGAVNPEAAAGFTQGMRDFLGAIPGGMWGLFASCFAVYTGGRSWEKGRGVAK